MDVWQWRNDDLVCHETHRLVLNVWQTSEIVAALGEVGFDDVSIVGGYHGGTRPATNVSLSSRLDAPLPRASTEIHAVERLQALRARRHLAELSAEVRSGASSLSPGESRHAHRTRSVRDVS